MIRRLAAEEPTRPPQGEDRTHYRIRQFLPPLPAENDHDNLEDVGAYLRRQRSRLGAPKAIAATAHKLARIIYNLMRYGLAYMQKSEQEYAAQVRERLEKQLLRRAKELGYTLTKLEAPAQPSPAEQPAAV